jgi:nicotinamide mononucleotide (NMN) deamidase PncC
MDLFNLAKNVVTELTLKKLTIGCAESWSGGLLSSIMTDIPGSSKIFEGSFISY